MLKWLCAGIPPTFCLMSSAVSVRLILLASFSADLDILLLPSCSSKQQRQAVWPTYRGPGATAASCRCGCLASNRRTSAASFMQKPCALQHRLRGSKVSVSLLLLLIHPYTHARTHKAPVVVQGSYSPILRYDVHVADICCSCSSHRQLLPAPVGELSPWQHPDQYHHCQISPAVT